MGFRWVKANIFALKHLLDISVIWLVMFTTLVFMTSRFRAFKLEQHDVTGE